jgi:hypothetical protein
MKRSRGRGGRRPPSNNNGSGGGGGGGGNNPNRTYDSNGPEIKIRGSASHVYEKYLQLARDANASGDRVMAENYLQHAEHYYRILAANQLHQQQYQAQQAPYAANGNGNGNGGNRPQANGNVDGNTAQPYVAAGPSFSLAEDDEDGDAALES